MTMVNRTAVVFQIFLLSTVAWMASGCAEEKVTESVTEDIRTERPRTLVGQPVVSDAVAVETDPTRRPPDTVISPKSESVDKPTPSAPSKEPASEPVSPETASLTPDAGNATERPSPAGDGDGDDGSPAARPPSESPRKHHETSDSKVPTANNDEDQSNRDKTPRPLVIGRRSSTQGSASKPLKEENKAPVEGVVPQAPEEIELKNVRDSIHKIKDEKLRQFLTNIAGTWKQTVENNRPDLFEGGYRTSQIHIGAEGIMEIDRSFDKAGSVILRRKFDYLPNDDGDLVLGGKVRPGDSVLIKKAIELPDEGGSVTRMIPASRSLPATVKVQLNGDSLVLDGKTYRRVK